jgi:Tfp pilus assembly protein PilF
MKIKVPEDIEERQALCSKARALIENGELAECEKLVCNAMERYPHMPEPNNLLGILLERRGDHVLAMKHFRAAWALDPSYRPARQNLDGYGSFYPNKRIAFDESDCIPDPYLDHTEIQYDAQGPGNEAWRMYDRKL